MKPISDKWIENWRMARFAINDARSAEKAAQQLARELQRTREAIRHHCMCSDEFGTQRIDDVLYRATLPEAN